jgi:cytochrome-b5 reductase
MSVRPALRTATTRVSGPSATGFHIVRLARLPHPRHQSTSSSSTQSSFKRYYLLAIPLAFLPFTLFGKGTKPLDPYVYSDQKVGSTSKLTPQHARVRIPLSASDSALFNKGENGTVVLEHVMIKNPDLQIERPYTPVNDVGADGEVDIVVKRVQGGEVGK